MRLKPIPLLGFSLVVLGVIVWFVVRPQHPKDEKPPATTKIEKRGRLVRRGRRPPVNARERVREIVSTEPKERRRNRRPSAEMFENLRGADRKLAEDIQRALDEDDYAGVMGSVDAAMSSANAEVRSHLVDALSWFGAEALPELTVLMADSDEDVAESAQTQWVIALSEIESPGKRMEIGLTVLATLTDENTLADVSGEVSNAALEYIDDESDESNPERQSEKRVEVVQALLDIMEGGRPACAEAAAETYEEITGHKWINIDEAELYLRNPDDYELPEDRDAETEMSAETPMPSGTEDHVGTDANRMGESSGDVSDGAEHVPEGGEHAVEPNGERVDTEK